MLLTDSIKTFKMAHIEKIKIKKRNVGLAQEVGFLLDPCF